MRSNQSQLAPGDLASTIARRFVLTTSAVIVGLFASFGTIQTWFLFFSTEPEHRQLLLFQLAKIDTFKGGIVLVGDSSLGNSIDAAMLAQVSARPVINLALTGLFGYAGSYNMTKRAIERGRVDTVVVMHTLDMMTRRQSLDGYLYSATRTSDLAEFDVRDTLALARTAGEMIWSRASLLATWRALMNPAPRLVFENDYVPQTSRRPILPEPPVPFLANATIPANLRFVEKLRSLCTKHGIRLIYAHGPYYDKAAMASAGYVGVVSGMLIGAGIAPPIGPVEIPADAIGDTLDHVSPAFKQEYTMRYLALLALGTSMSYRP